MKKVIILSSLALMLAGCQTGGPKQTGGTLIGAAGGALIGSQFGSGTGQLVGTALGTLGGAMAGGYIGKEMDDKDKK
jgi:uncharacterized protein YcfJ